jgi:hypothetical protein
MFDLFTYFYFAELLFVIEPNQACSAVKVKEHQFILLRMARWMQLEKE